MRLSAQLLADGVQRWKLADRPDSRQRRRVSKRGRAGRLDLFGRHGVDPRHDLLAWDDAAPGEKLTGVALCPPAGGLQSTWRTFTF